MLRLAVGVSTVKAAPRGVLLFLTGGPGQPGIPFLTRIHTRLRAALAGYRLVMFDQRGTGADALECPALQQAAGASDLAVVPEATVADCARSIGGARRYYVTAETVADIDALRSALGAVRLTLDGVSYGTYVAERYALQYPTHAARIVLDSVVPQAGVDPTYGAALSASGRVLRSVCAAERCGWDPAADLSAVVNRLHDGPAVLDARSRRAADRRLVPRVRIGFAAITLAGRSMSVIPPLQGPSPLGTESARGKRRELEAKASAERWTGQPSVDLIITGGLSCPSMS